LRNAKDLLLTAFEVSAYGSALLLLPCAFAGLFGCALADILIPIMLGAIAGTVVLTGIAIHEGWYFDHLTGCDVAPERVEPTFALPPQAGTKPLKSHPVRHGPRVVSEEREKVAA